MLSDKAGVPWLSVLAEHEQRTADLVDKWLLMSEVEQMNLVVMMKDIFKTMDESELPMAKEMAVLIGGFCKHGFADIYTKACQRTVDLQSDAQ